MVDRTVRTYLSDSRQGGTPSGIGRTMIDADRGIGGFLVGTGRTGNFEARGDRDQIDYGSAGVIGGLDFGLGAAMVGITGGYESSDVRLNRISPNSKAETYFIGGYGTFGFGPAYVDLVGSYGKTDLDLRRNVSFSDFNAASSGVADARYYSLSATAGISRDFGSFEVEPYLGARYADVRIDAFNESGGFTGLRLGEQEAESLQGVAGLRLGADYPMGNVRIRPSARAEYRHEFENDGPRVISTSFAGAGIATPFTTTTTPMGDDQLVVGAGLTIAGEGPVSMVADYTGQFLGGYEIHGVQVGLRIKL
jgi:outer membrane autotransporter protein